MRTFSVDAPRAFGYTEHMPFRIAALALLVAACTTSPTETGPCGAAPQQPDFAVTTSNGTSCMATDQWDGLTAWMSAVEDWELCIINTGSAS